MLSNFEHVMKVSSYDEVRQVFWPKLCNLKASTFFLLQLEVTRENIDLRYQLAVVWCFWLLTWSTESGSDSQAVTGPR